MPNPCSHYDLVSHVGGNLLAVGTPNVRLHSRDLFLRVCKQASSHVLASRGTIQGKTVPESRKATVFQGWGCCPMDFSLHMIKNLDSCNLQI